ncbi:MAG: preprotein translocase subunit SecE [Candidatus Wildermuthbacteria bacterium]|nr:preprotein translocase subunit SecE [Candidatus Wildermuthbacteria bacterium]
MISFQTITQFLQEVRIEVKKVNWPTSRETMINTLIVVVFSVAVAIFLGLFDVLFSFVRDKLIIG